MSRIQGAPLLLVWLLLISSPVLSQSLKTLSPDKRYMRPDWETYYSKIPVGGEINVGLMAYENHDKIVPTSFFVKIPKHIQQVLCVEISSRDGRYQAKLPYNIAGFGSGIYQLELPTHYKNELKNYTINNITILTKIAKSCDQDAECYVLSAWNKPIFSNQQAYIYLNSEQHTELILKSSPNSSTEHIIECEKIAESTTTAYNCLCKISGYDLNEFSDIQVRRIIIKLGRRTYSFFDLPIRF